MYFYLNGRPQRFIKTLLGLSIRFLGIGWLIRVMNAQHKISILVYHDPKPSVFCAHINYLSRHYNFISIDEAVSAVENKNLSKLPRYPLLITFDDGHKGNVELLPIFRKYGVKPTIYLCSQIVGTNRRFWFNVTVQGHESLKRLQHDTRLKELFDCFNFTETDETRERQALSMEEVELMKNDVIFGAHSRFHPVLTTCNNERCHEEIFVSKTDLEDMLGVPCEHFAYPNGDYEMRELDLVRESGYRSARTLDVGWNDVKSNILRLKAITVPDEASVSWLLACLTGVPTFLRYLMQGCFCGMHPVIRSKKSITVQ